MPLSWEAQMVAYKARVEVALDQWLPSATTRPTRLHEAMRYSLEAGGKRIRPVLVLAAADLFPQQADPLPAAVAVECLHTYTLIHDDLPCMDDSAMRRGRPTCHKQYDEVTAVLAGDALLTHAFLVIARGYINTPAIATALTTTLASASGSEHLIGGQLEDTLGEGMTLSADAVEFIHLNKTAALIAASITMGLSCTTATPEQVGIGHKIGMNLGLAFQVVDDILDVTSTTETLGKTVGNDAELKKNTYVSLHGLEASRAIAARLTTETLLLCEQLSPNAAFLSELVRYLQHRVT
ncbi:MAG: polyprenyl synthetase family protein [Verrucomicrobiota bacterium]|nr:polyprenyl synthetase family protein [Verrucomicrobiota bacterium]